MTDTKKANAGLAGAVRQTALKPSDLSRAERHGKREDEISQQRRIREEEPLVYGTLDLVEARAKHMEGVKQSGKTAAIHALVQFPTGLIDGVDEQKQQWMLSHAVSFLNDHHGGDAVFAARLDRDEAGMHTVDAFLLPRYDFHYRDGRTVKKASVSKFSKEHARERYFKTDKETGELILKDGKPIPRDDTRAQGSALQDRWFEYMRDEMKLEGVMPPERKKYTAKDRVEPEVYGLQQDQKKQERQKQSLKTSAKTLVDGTKQLAAERAAFEAEKAKARPALEAAQRLAERQGNAARAEKLGSFKAAVRPSEGRTKGMGDLLKKSKKKTGKKPAKQMEKAMNTIIDMGDER